MKVLYRILGFACYGWAAYSAFRFLFTQTDYVGWQWILSIVVEVALGSYFISKARNGGDDP
jgi:hypothetical protein